MDLSYELSEDDRILAVGDGWDTFGAGNNAGKLGVDIIGYPIWNFISGQDTRSYMNSIFFFCRSQSRSLSALYRGDSPTMMRVFRMTVEPRKNDGLCLSHHLAAEMPHWHKVPTIRIPRRLVQCSQCLSIKDGQTWSPGPGPAFRAKQAISYHVCPDCRHSLSRQIDTAMQMRRETAATTGSDILMA